MACVYTYKGKTYSREELINHLENEQGDVNFKPSFENIEQILNASKQSEKKEVSKGTTKRLDAFIKKQIETLRTRLVNFETASERRAYLPKEQTVDKISELKDKLTSLESIDAFFENANFVEDELKNVQDFLDNKFDITNEDHIHFIFQIQKQLESYKDLAELLPEMSDYNDEIAKQSKTINNIYKDVSERMDEIVEEHLINFFKTNSKQNLTDDDIKLLLKESKDISWQEKQIGGLSNSMDPLLQLLHKHVQKTREQIYDNTNSWNTKIVEAGKKLKEAGIEGFDWMFQKAKDGKLTGRVLQRINETYYKDRKAITDKLKNSTGDKREYIYKPWDTLSSEEKKHNIALAKDKKELSTFLKAENIDANGITDGENHKYNDEFKTQRALFEKLTNDNGFQYWEKRKYIPGSVDTEGNPITEEVYNRMYDKYKRTYYTEPKDTLQLVKDKNGIPTGEVEIVSRTYVKPEYVEIISERNGAKTKYGDSNYYSLMNDNSPQAKAKKEFFEFYTNTSNELLDKTNLATKRKMAGKMFRIKNSLVKDIKNIGVFNTMKKTVRNWINPDVVFTSREVDEQGNLLEDVPIFFTNELKSETKISELNKKLEDLRSKLTSNPSDKSLMNKIKLIKSQITIEENKLTPEELETDMIKSLTLAAQMAENYDLMKNAENTILMIKKIIAKKDFFKLDAAGQKQYLNPGTSNVQQRLDSYLRMIFYGNSMANQNKVSKLIQNFNSFVAYKSLGLNPFSAINNTVMANINNRIEAFGNQFGFTNKHLNSAIADTTGYVTGLSYMKNIGKDEYLLNPTNKFEAMLKKFNWIDRNQIIEDSSTISKLMFMGITGGEFIAQSNTAIAKLRSEMLTNTKTGETSSIWEAHEFVNGELKLKDGYELTPNKRQGLSVDIKNMNKIIHGNYSDADKVAMQEHALAQSVMQFKKWIYNFGKSRWGNTYYDETIGDYAEGRYKTFANFIKVLKAGQAFDLNSIKEAFKNLSSYEKSNLKKLQVEGIYWMTATALMLLLEGISKGLDDDDDELRMLVNFLQKQSDRVGGELDAALNPKSIAANLKNPVSGLRTANDFGDVLVNLVKLPYQYASNDKDMFIRRGPNKNQLRLSKELQDVIPIANLEHQFDQLMTSGNFYFK